ncbi:MAG: sigma-70 family RNA polymerase sigma factor [Brevinematia bacterium]
MENEAELIYRIVCGDENAFAELYNKYSKSLISFVYKYTRDVDMSIDVVQETFVRFIENINTYSPKGRFKSFIFKTALNIIRDRKRREKRERKVIEEIAYNSGCVSNGDNMKEEMMCIVDSLPDREKEILLLRLEGYKIEEIAEMESCSSRTIKRILKKTINEIKSKLGLGGNI